MRAAVAGFLFVHPAQAQTVQPDIGGATRDQAQRNAESQARERAARQAAPDVHLEPFTLPSLGAFPVEQNCFPIREVVINGAENKILAWLPELAKSFTGHCVGHDGLNYILKALQGEIISRGLVTTRVGLPEQDLSKGILRIQVVPGVISSVKAPSNRAAREWDFAFPQSTGDVLQLRAMEQGLEQMRRIPGRQVSVDIAPNTAPGESVLDLKVEEAPQLAGNLSVNNYSGATVGRWQGSASLTAADVLGLNELMTVNYNNRLSSPDLPANSVGDYVTFSIPYGWWTFSITGSTSRYQQEILGSVANFESLGTQKGITANAEMVIHRDQSSHTSLQFQLQRRWNRSYIDDTEIGLQHQDLTDMQVAVLDRHNFGSAEFDSQLAYRQGVHWLGAQQDDPGRTSDLPTSLYQMATLDITGTVPLDWSPITSYHIEARGQYGFNTPFGSDLFAVGGVYSVRGYESDTALLGKSGWYLRQEVTGPAIVEIAQPFLFVDMGRVNSSDELLAGIGPGIRASYHGISLSAFAAAALSHPPYDRKSCCQLGLNVSYNF